MVETAPDANVPEVLLGRPFGEAGLRFVREELGASGGACRANWPVGFAVGWIGAPPVGRGRS